MAHVSGSEPYPWPYDGDLSPDHLALVLAGWDETWSARSVDAAGTLAAVGPLAEAVHAFGGLVIGVAHGGAVALPLPTPGISAAAHGIDAFYGGPLDIVLREAGRTHLFVAGFGLEGPVHSSLRDANDRGYECLLVVDATAALTATLVAAAVRTIHMSGGIFGATGTVAAVVAALAVHPDPTLAQEATP